MSHDPDTLAFLNVLRRGVTIEIHHEDMRYTTSTEIQDADPDGHGGVLLTLDAGTLLMTAEMIASATKIHDNEWSSPDTDPPEIALRTPVYEPPPHAWEVRRSGLVFRFGTTYRWGAWVHGDAAKEPAKEREAREAQRNAKLREQKGDG
jgi:hypothetical protein